MSTAVVIGGGPAGLIAAEVLARAGVAVTVRDRMPSVGRKFLLAGHGGLNITHSEARDQILARYGGSADRLAPMLDVFGPEDLRDWCAGLGEPTFVGSSGRVFPRAFRATPLFRAWLARLAELGVRVETRQRWTGWAGEDGGLSFTGADGGTVEVSPDVAVFALGGASWPRLGSDGGWVGPFADRGVTVTPLRPANVGVRVAWTDVFVGRFEGTPLKNVGLTVRGRRAQQVRGDAMVTRSGIEGGPVYAIGAAIRDALDAGGRCVLHVDLRPDLTVDQLADRLQHRRPKDSGSTWLRRSIGLDPVAIALLRESTGATLPSDPAAMAELITAVPVVVTATMPIDRAISTAGGIAWPEVDDSLMLRRLPGTFVAGEMLDWEESTGGTLPTDPAAMAELITAVPVVVTATMPIERAISTAGGIAWSEVDESLMLRRLPGTFVAGEMLDWEAPTGGYLLQASFSTGIVAARGALAWLEREAASGTS